MDRECGNKIQFNTRHSATLAMEKGIEDGFLKGHKQDFNAYQCPQCWYYHFGHIPIGAKRSWV